MLGEEEDYQVSSGGDGVEEQRVGDNDCKKSRVQKWSLCDGISRRFWKNSISLMIICIIFS